MSTGMIYGILIIGISVIFMLVIIFSKDNKSSQANSIENEITSKTSIDDNEKKQTEDVLFESNSEITDMSLLLKYKEMLDNDLISQEEYDNKKTEYLENIEDSSVNENNDEKPKKSSKKKWWIWILIIVIVAGGIFGYSNGYFDSFVSSNSFSGKEHITLNDYNVEDYLYIDVSFLNVKEESVSAYYMNLYEYTGDLSVKVTPKSNSYEFDFTSITVDVKIGTSIDNQTVTVQVDSSGNGEKTNSVTIDGGMVPLLNYNCSYTIDSVN